MYSHNITTIIVAVAQDYINMEKPAKDHSQALGLESTLFFSWSEILPRECFALASVGHQQPPPCKSRYVLITPRTDHLRTGLTDHSHHSSLHHNQGVETQEQIWHQQAKYGRELTKSTMLQYFPHSTSFDIL